VNRLLVKLAESELGSQWWHMAEIKSSSEIKSAEMALNTYLRTVQ